VPENENDTFSISKMLLVMQNIINTFAVVKSDV